MLSHGTRVATQCLFFSVDTFGTPSVLSCPVFPQIELCNKNKLTDRFLSVSLLKVTFNFDFCRIECKLCWSALSILCVSITVWVSVYTNNTEWRYMARTMTFLRCTWQGDSPFPSFHSICTFRFLTLFVRGFPLRTVVVLWDFLLAEGLPGLIPLTVSLLKVQACLFVCCGDRQATCMNVIVTWLWHSYRWMRHHASYSDTQTDTLSCVCGAAIVCAVLSIITL